MRTLIILFVIYMVMGHPLFSQEELNIDFSATATKHKKNSLLIEIVVKNNSKEDIYIPMACWEVHYLKDHSNTLLAYPYENYAVNFFVVKDTSEGFRYRGHYCNTPKFKCFPKVHLLKNNLTFRSIKV